MNGRSAVAVLMLLAFSSACAGGGSNSVNPSTQSPTQAMDHKAKPQDTLGGVGGSVGGALTILLGDAPPQIGNLVASQINLGIDSVAVVSNGTVTTLASYSKPYVVNVMQNQGDPSPIGIGQYYSGPYDHIVFRFDVASSNVVAGGTNYPITFLTNAARSSAGAGTTTVTTAQNGAVTVTVAGNFMENGNPAQAIQADFNALESLAMSANGTIVSRPALFAIPYDQAGQVAGTVTSSQGTPVAGATVVALDANGNVGNTGSTDANGNFQLHTLAAGTWQLVVYNTYQTVSGQTLTATGNGSPSPTVQGPTVTVTAGQTAAAGTIAD